MKRISHLRKSMKLLTLTLVFSMLLCLLPLSSSAHAATVKPKLSRSSVVLTVGKSVKFTMKGSHIVSARFSSTNKKIAVVSRKSKTGTIKGKKKGTCKIKAVIRYKKSSKSRKIYRKTLYIKVRVKNPVKTVIPVDDQKDEETPAVNETETTGETQSDAFVGQTADFSISLFKKASEEKIAKGDNALISAESVMNAMLMTANGAEGRTLTQLTAALAGSESLADYMKEFSSYNKQLQSSKAVVFHSANSIWLKDDENQFTVNKTFLQTNQDLLDAEVCLDPFTRETVGKINSWVSKNTDGMINKVVDSIDDDEIMYLINALAFEGRWAEQYKSGQIEKGSTFTNSKGETEDATMLRDSGYTYLSDDNALGFMRSYEDGNYAFVAIRPNDGVTVEDYLKNMTGESFLSFCQSAKRGTVITRIPKFSYDDSYDLSDTLKALGITDAFDEDLANFTGMGSTPVGNIYLSNVIHKTHIELDENGTKAAAVTAVVMRVTSMGPNQEDPIEITLDKPFIYAIVDTQTNLPVFMGVVNTVK